MSITNINAVEPNLRRECFLSGIFTYGLLVILALIRCESCDGTRNRAFFDILVINRTIKYVSIFFVTN